MQHIVHVSNAARPTSAKSIGPEIMFISPFPSVGHGPLAWQVISLLYSDVIDI
jgi:hypothetical protein